MINMKVWHTYFNNFLSQGKSIQFAAGLADNAYEQYRQRRDL